MIKQKLILKIAQQQEKNKNTDSKVFILYLPYEEIHEIGLLYAHYEILAAGHKSIYLGANIPISSLKNITQHYQEITFVSYFTVKPDKRSIDEYIKDYKTEIDDINRFNLWLLGPKTFNTKGNRTTGNIKIIPSYDQFINFLKV